MSRYVAFLRGINVGRANRVAMSELKTLVEALGYQRPRTLLNSGNVVFEGPASPTTDVAEKIGDALAQQLGVSSNVIVLTAEEYSRAMAENPLVDIATDSTRLLVGFLADRESVVPLEPIALDDWSPESVALGERVVYAWCPNGVIASRLLPALARVADDSITTRNWATALKVLAAFEGKVPMAEVEFRRATPDDSPALSAIAREAKAFWGYSPALLDLWSTELTVEPGLIASSWVLCACIGDAIVGFVAVCEGAEGYDLEHLWVRPSHMGRGIGTQLLARARNHLGSLGATSLRIVSDPNAERFYLKAGARRVGEVDSTPSGRRLPLLELDV